MLVEGSCANGHELVCSVQEGRLSGVKVNGRLRDACPVCGGKPYVVVESGTVAATSKIPSDWPLPMEATTGRRD